MRQSASMISTVASAAVLMGTLAIMPATTSAAEEMTVIEQGKELAYDRKLGNCLACHQVGEGSLPGNIGPPLVAMKARFPDRAKLRAQIWDSTASNPNSIMPPFGKYKIVSEDDIDKIVEYIYTL